MAQELKYTEDGYPYYDSVDQGSNVAGNPVAIPIDYDPWERAAERVKRSVVNPNRPQSKSLDEFIQPGGLLDAMRQMSPQEMLATVAALPAQMLPAKTDMAKAVTPGGKLDELFGVHPQTERYQLWPEKMVRSGGGLAHDVMTGELPTIDPNTGRTNEKVIERALDMSGLMGAGSLPGVAARGVAKDALGVVPVAAAKKTNVPVQTKFDPEFMVIVKNHPDIQITPEGVKINLIRGQNPEISEKSALSGTVSYGLASDKNIATKYIGENREMTPWGGTDLIKGETLFKNPLIIKSGEGVRRSTTTDALKQLIGKNNTFKLKNIVDEIEHPTGIEDGSILIYNKYYGKNFELFDTATGSQKQNMQNNVNKELKNTSQDRSLVREQKSKIKQEELLKAVFTKFSPDLLPNLRHYLDMFSTVSDQGSNIRNTSLLNAIMGDIARKAGHDGIIIHGKNSVKEVFDLRESHYPTPEGGYKMHSQFYSDSGTPGAPLSALAQQAKASPFYSAVERAIEGSSTKSAPAEQWLGFLKNQPGVKQEELAWLGLDELKGPVTKEQLLEHAKGHSPEVQVKVKSGTDYANPEEAIGEYADKILKGWEGLRGKDTALEIRKRQDGMYDMVDRNNNIVQVVDSTLDGRKIQKQFDEMIKNQDPDIMMDWSQSAADNNFRAGDSPRYGDYQLPGGTNYREMLLTLRDNKFKDEARLLELERKYKNSSLNSAELAEKEKILESLDQSAHKQSTKYPFTSFHWDEPNVLAHVRMNDRIIPMGRAGGAPGHQLKLVEGGQVIIDKDGKVISGVYTKPESANTQLELANSGPQQNLNSLHLEEVQSDWHQAGRKQGYKQEEASKLRKDWEDLSKQYTAEEANKISLELKGNQTGAAAAKERMNSLRDQAHELRLKTLKAEEGVPDAPFKSSWPDLTLKRAIRVAAEEGKDAISWTPGAQQAARYVLSKHIDSLKWFRDGGIDGKQYRIVAKKGGNTVIEKTVVSPDELASTVGKDIAEKIVKNEEQNGELKGLDLKVGGEGMIKFYDKMLVDKMNAIAKKYGSKVEYADITPKYEIHEAHGVYNIYAPGADDVTYAVGSKAKAEQWIKDNTVKAPFVRLTPQMKDAALGKGFPMFARGVPLPLEPVDHDPFNDVLPENKL